MVKTSIHLLWPLCLIPVCFGLTVWLSLSQPDSQLGRCESTKLNRSGLRKPKCSETAWTLASRSLLVLLKVSEETKIQITSLKSWVILGLGIVLCSSWEAESTPGWQYKCPSKSSELMSYSILKQPWKQDKYCPANTVKQGIRFNTKKTTFLINYAIICSPFKWND